MAYMNFQLTVASIDIGVTMQKHYCSADGKLIAFFPDVPCTVLLHTDDAAVLAHHYTI